MVSPDSEVAVLRADVDNIVENVKGLRKDFDTLSASVGGKLAEISQYIAEERGAKQALALVASNKQASQELTSTKIMAIAAIIGAIESMPQYIHFFFR